MNTLVTTAENLCKVVLAAEKDRDEKLAQIRHREQVAMGAMADKFDRGESPENIALGVYTILAPSMVTSSPGASIMTSGGYREHVQAAALGHTVTQMAQGQKMERALEPAAWDFFFSTFCAGMVETGRAHVGDLTSAERRAVVGRMRAEDEEAGRGEMDAKAPRGHATPAPSLPPEWARFKHLRPDECGWDTRMGTRDRARFTWHSMLEDRAALEGRAEAHPDDWISESCKMCATADKIAGANAAAYTDEANEYVKYYVVYVPGGTLEERPPKPNEPGVIYTIGATVGEHGKVNGLEIRRPYYWQGHPDGLHIFEGNYTPGCTAHFLSLLSGNEDSIGMLESVSAALHQRIRDRKSVHAYDTMAEEGAQAIMKAPHGGFVGVPGLSEGAGAIQTIETDAPTPAEINEYDRMRFNAGRALGIDDSGLGNADPDATATAVGVAANATRTKVDYLLSRWDRFVGAAMERMAFDAAHNDRVVVRLNEDGREGVLRAQLQPLVARGILSNQSAESVIEDQKMRPMLYQGGDFANDAQGLDWYGMQLRVDPFSMEGSFGERQLAREAQWNQLLSFLGQMLIQQPHIRWIERIRKTGRALGMSDAEMAVDLEIAEQVAQIQLAQASHTPMTTSSAPNVQDRGPALATGAPGPQPQLVA